MQEDIAQEIERLRIRLAEIEEERADTSEDDPDREGLLREERPLEVRLGELEEQVAKDRGEAEEKVASQTDLTKTPKLPEDGDQS